MTPQQIIGVGIRLFAVMLALSTLTYIATIPHELAQSGSRYAGYAYLGVGVYLLAAALLWFFPMSIANRIVPRTRFENRISLQALEAARVGCSLIGLWLLAKTLPSVVWLLFNLLAYSGHDSLFRSLSEDLKYGLLSAVVQGVLALVLIFRSGDFAALVIREKKQPADE
jgi:hypothetical protein